MKGEILHGLNIERIFETKDSALDLQRYEPGHARTYYRKLGREALIVVQGNLTINDQNASQGKLVTLKPGTAIDIKADQEAVVFSVISGPAQVNDRFSIPAPRAMSKDGPLVSVVVTAFNVADVISTTLLSFIEQTYPNIEIVVVDDASTDGTAKVLADFAAVHTCVRILTNEKNLGAALAKQRGLRAAKGDYFLLVDGDDCFEPNTISESMKVIELTEADTLIFGFDLLNDETGELSGPELPVTMTELPYILRGRAELDCEKLARLNHVSWVCLLKSSVHQQTFSDAFLPLPYWEDVPTFIAMIAQAQILAFVNEPFCHYRVGRQGQAVNNWGKARRGLKSACFEKVVNYLSTVPWASDKFVRRLIANKLGKIAISEFALMRNGSDHEYKLAVMQYQTASQNLSAREILSVPGLKFKIFMAALRWGSVDFARLIFATGLR